MYYSLAAFEAEEMEVEEEVKEEKEVEEEGHDKASTKIVPNISRQEKTRIMQCTEHLLMH